MNVHPAELSKFEAMAEGWWDPTGWARPLHVLNPVRLQFITDKALISGKKILDIGCGGGILSERLARRGGQVTGLDLSPTLLQVAREHAKKEALTVEYLEVSVERYASEASEKFDVVVCMELLEHVPSPLSVLKAAAQLLKPEGHLFLSTLNRTLSAYVFGILGAEYILNILPRGTHQYEQFIKPSELEKDLRTAGFELQALQGVRYNPFSHQAKISTDLSINYLAHARPHTPF